MNKQTNTLPSESGSALLTSEVTPKLNATQGSLESQQTVENL